MQTVNRNMCIEEMEKIIMSPLLSIIVPVYNKEERLHICVDSIYQKSRYKYEVIIIEDCSTDNSRNIVFDLKRKHEDMIVICNDKNRGAGYSRNVGIEKANGKYLWFVDADDTICEGAIDELINAIELYNLDVLFFDMVRESLDDTYCVKYIENYEKSESEDIYSGIELFNYIYRNGRIWESACRQIIDREFCLENKIYFPENMSAEDTAYSFTLFVKAKRVKYISKAYYRYNKFNNSVTHSRTNIHMCVDGLVAFCKMQEAITSLNYNDKRIFGHYLHDYYSFLKRCMVGEDSEQIKYYIDRLEPKYAYMYDIFFSLDKEEKPINYDILNAIKRYNKIVIYGAGPNARRMANIVDKLEKEIVAYAISDEYVNDKMNPKYIMGVKVLPISKLLYLSKDKDTLFIVATEVRYAVNIVNNLNKFGFQNIVTMYSIENKSLE